MKKLDTKSIAQESSRLLSLPEYQNVDDAINIARILIAQIEINELKKHGYSNYRIGAIIGVNEKTIRFWHQGDQCPKLENAYALDELYSTEQNKERKTR